MAEGAKVKTSVETMAYYNMILTEAITPRRASVRLRKTQMDRADLPSLELVENADGEQLAKWYRFLPPGDRPEQRKIRHRFAE
jgi:hypothetical protein